jgi:hypothetical protein
MRYILLIYLIHFSYGSYSQKDIKINSENKYIAICETIVSLEEFNKFKIPIEYNGKMSVFFISNEEYISDDKKINIDLDNLTLSIWFKKELFFNNIRYWVELTEIVDKGRIVYIKFHSYNTVDSYEMKSTFKGELKLKYEEERFKIVKKKLTIL